jgi:hypothetical protein
MYFQYLLCKVPCEIPMEFSSPTPELGLPSLALKGLMTLGMVGSEVVATLKEYRKNLIVISGEFHANRTACISQIRYHTQKFHRKLFPIQFHRKLFPIATTRLARYTGSMGGFPVGGLSLNLKICCSYIHQLM